MSLTTAPAGPTGIERPPVTGWPAGLGMGTVRGLGAIVLLAGGGAVVSAPVAAVSGPFVLVVLAAGAAVGAAVGVVYTPYSMAAGATTAPATDEVDRAELVLRRFADDPGIADRFSALFVERARARTGRTFVDRNAATTVVELRILSLGAGQRWDWDTFDRPFGIRAEASARVVRVADGAVVWESVRKVGDGRDEGITHTYVEWAADGGADLRRATDEALRKLAEEFVLTIFEGVPPAR